MRFGFGLFIFIALKSANGFRETKLMSSVNDVLDGLAREQWKKEEESCRRSTEDILNGVKNNTLWATWVWDSMQLPVGTFYGSLYHLGNFDQCLKSPWPFQQDLQTQYCLVDVKLAASRRHDGITVDPYDDAVGYIGAESRRRNRPNVLFLGVCLPASCSTESVAKISRHIMGISHLSFEDVVVDGRDCQLATQPGSSVDKPIGFYVFWYIILIMTSICILVYLFGNNQNESDAIVSKITHCFCLTRNFNALLDIHKDEIKMMCGMRAITCGILIVSHYIFLSLRSFVNQVDAEHELFNNPFTKLALHLDLCVDTFFLMSGLLYFKGLLTDRTYQPFKKLLKRYIRLILPLYLLSIFCISYVLPHLGSGPLWPRMARTTFEPCARTWWRNLLMLTNKVDDVSICSETSWSLHCDFQLTILTTIIFALYRKNKRTGAIFGLLVYTSSAVLFGGWLYWHQLPGILWYDFGDSIRPETNKLYQSIYTLFYTRSSSYLIGVAMGYLMVVYKPQNYRNTLSKGISIIGFITGMTLQVSTLLIGVKIHRKQFSPLLTAVIATLDKSVWSMGICAVLVVCEYGTLPVIPDFLGSKMFVLLSKLTYSAYLFHMMFLYRDTFSIRTLTKFDMMELITRGLGYVVISAVTCYLAWFFIEAPVTNLINLIFESKRTPSDQRNNFEGHHNYSNGTTKTKKIL